MLFRSQSQSDARFLQLTGGTLSGDLSGTTSTFSGDVTIADKIVHSGDTNTAIRFPAVDTFAVETDGSERFRVNSSGNILIPDNGKVIFGAGSDLSIYHDGSHSYISDQGTGHLKVFAESFFLNNSDDTEQMIGATVNGAVDLFFNGSKKLATSATGVTVTGTVAATAFTGDGSGLTGVGFTTNVVTGNTTASKDNHYYLNGSAISLSLPASPSVGDEVRLSEVAGNTNCVIGRNGSNIMGSASNLTIDTAYLVLYLRYVDSTIGWAFS